jgi:hypothetical protein
MAEAEAKENRGLSNFTMTVTERQRCLYIRLQGFYPQQTGLCHDSVKRHCSLSDEALANPRERFARMCDLAQKQPQKWLMREEKTNTECMSL